MRRSYPEMAAALRAASERALERWVSTVRESLLAADELTFAQLRDDLPAVLQQVARALEADRAAPTEALIAVSSAHGATRYHQSYNLSELLVEYDMLRPVLIEEVMRQLGRRVEAEEVVVLNTALDVCVRRGVCEFVEHQTRQLRAATEAQSKYLSFLSHDLRGGLNGVFLMIEVLRRELAKEPKFSASLEDLDMMRRSIFETIGTMDRFLNAERFRKGKIQVRPARVSVKSLLAEVSAQFVYQAKDKGVALQSHAPDNCEVISDKELVTLILQNLLANAVKYSAKGTVTVSGEPEPGGGCRVTVADEGPGIASDKLNDLFAPFARGETHGQSGVGLGLSIARQAAERLKAKLWAESEPGKGSKFFLVLPNEIRAEAAPAEASEKGTEATRG